MTYVTDALFSDAISSHRFLPFPPRAVGTFFNAEIYASFVPGFMANGVS